MPLSPSSEEFKSIQAAIFSKNPKPGEKVATEDEVMQKLHMTRYKVRQGFDLLVQMGILERHKKRGTVVKRIATGDMTENILEQFKIAGFDELEFNEARMMIECSIIPYVSKRITPAILAEMRTLIESIKRHADNPVDADFFFLQFHLLLFKSCGNRVLEIFATVVRTYFKSTKHLIENSTKEETLARAQLCENFLVALINKKNSSAAKIMKNLIMSTSNISFY